MISGIRIPMPLLHGRPSRRLGPIIATISTRRNGLAGLAQLCAAFAAAVDAEEQSEKDQSASTDTDTNHQLLVVANPAHSR